jgi:hypothetical protein
MTKNIPFSDRVKKSISHTIKILVPWLMVRTFGYRSLYVFQFQQLTVLYRYLPTHFLILTVKTVHIKNILERSYSCLSKSPKTHNSRLQERLTFFGRGGGWKCLKVSSLSSASCLTEVVSSGLLHRSRNRSNRLSRSSGPEDMKGCGYHALPISGSRCITF